MRRTPIAFLVSLCALLATGGPLGADEPTLLTKPYLQLGAVPDPRALTLLWHTDDTDAEWTVDYRPTAESLRRGAFVQVARRVAVLGVAPHRVHRASLSSLEPGKIFTYRLLRAGRVVFESHGHAPKAPEQAHRFVAFGDCGANTPEQKAVAQRAFLERPDYVVIPGDIVYGRGRITEYRDNFWPIYNADTPSPSVGAPLMRSTPFVAAPGNHDIAIRDLEKYPDGLAYFYDWDQPLNGPDIGPGADSVVGVETDRKAFLTAAETTFPRMANFSFDYGGVHWTIIDSNPYPGREGNILREWVAHGLAAAKDADWRFVVFHHPGFNASRAHYEAQHMRKFAETFEQGRVDLVLSGHVHNYQRTHPMKFTAGEPALDRPLHDAKGKLLDGPGRIPGRWTLDTRFDGRTNTRADGVIYLITGAGGQKLYDPDQQDQPETWQPFIARFISKVHSLTVADVTPKSVTIRQLSPDGAELDRFTISR